MYKFFKAQSVVFGVLVAVNLLVAVSVQQEQERSADTVRVAAPEGMKYMEYCDGGVSDILIQEQENSCAAEYPGDFARMATLSLSVLLFALFPLVYVLWKKVRMLFFAS